MTDVHLDTGLLTFGASMESRDHGDRIEAVYDPTQTSAPEALAVLFLTYPRLVASGYRLLHATR